MYAFHIIDQYDTSGIFSDTIMFVVHVDNPKLISDIHIAHGDMKCICRTVVVYAKHHISVFKYETLLQQGISEPIFYGDLVYKFKRIV